MSKDILEEVNIWNDPDNYDYRCYDKACELVGRLSGYVVECREQLQQAHREGWEQGKRECVNIADNLFKYESGYYHYKEDVADAIAAMEYKEKANDRV